MLHSDSDWNDFLGDSSDEIESHELVVEKEPKSIYKGPKGKNCIINFDHFWDGLKKAFAGHDKIGLGCNFDHLEKVERKTNGVGGEVLFKCSLCNLEKKILFHSKEEYGINELVVIGADGTGMGQTGVAEFLCALDIDPMCNDTYRKSQEKVYVIVKKIAEKEMEKAAEEEYKIAKEKAAEEAVRGEKIVRHEVDGIMFITVVTDGSWMKRSYKFGTYDSPSGIGVIVGEETKKVLHVGIKNSQCSRCDRHARKLRLKPHLDPAKNPVPEHICVKNWSKSQSSTSMEAKAIAEGFCESISKHKLIFETVIADGAQ